MTDPPAEPVVAAFHRTLDWLREERLPFFVLGGIAFQVHGIPRATFDVDVAVAGDALRVLRFLRRVSADGAIVEEPFLRGWTDRVGGSRKVAFLIPFPSRAVPVDVFLVESPFERSAFARRRRAALHGRTFSVVAPEDLILFKLLAGRRKDDADVVDLLLLAGRLDFPYLRRWAARLGVTKRLRGLAREAGTPELR
jgi:hypothetical protein